MPNPLSSNIYLIGFMASGKSTIGKLLANQLQLPFTDLDSLIEKKAQLNIPQIFDQKGEAYFRQLEKECLQNTFHQSSGVIATGGGAPCFFDNMEQMNKAGTTIYLSVPPAELSRRLIKEKANRPLVSQFQSEEKLKQFIIGKLEERSPFYEKAQITLQCQSLAASKIADYLAHHLKRLP